MHTHTHTLQQWLVATAHNAPPAPAVAAAACRAAQQAALQDEALKLLQLLLQADLSTRNVQLRAGLGDHRVALLRVGCGKAAAFRVVLRVGTPEPQATRRTCCSSLQVCLSWWGAARPPKSSTNVCSSSSGSANDASVGVGARARVACVCVRGGRHSSMSSPTPAHLLVYAVQAGLDHGAEVVLQAEVAHARVGVGGVLRAGCWRGRCVVQRRLWLLLLQLAVAWCLHQLCHLLADKQQQLVGQSRELSSGVCRRASCWCVQFKS
jgi:hypothetical protein